MSNFIKQGIQEIKDTKKYAREKNVMNWLYEAIFATALVFLLNQLTTFYGIVFVFPILADYEDYFAYLLAVGPFITTALLMIRFGKYPIKLMIIKQFYIQKATLKLLNKLDMYFWRKTGKDTVATQFVIKYRIPVQIIFYLPLFLVYLF